MTKDVKTIAEFMRGVRAQRQRWLAEAERPPPNRAFEDMSEAELKWVACHSRTAKRRWATAMLQGR